MLNIQELTVRSFSREWLDVFWDVEPCSDDILAYKFVVERSDAQFEEYSAVGPAQVGQFWFRDTSVVGKDSIYRRVWYRLRIINRRTGETRVHPETGGVTLGAKPDLQALELARQNNLSLRVLLGRMVWVFPKRRSGQRCANCWDEVLRKRVAENCLSCYGTGFAGGYFSPIETYMQIVSPDEYTPQTPQGRAEIENTIFKLGNFPVLGAGDLVVEAENVRWLVSDRLQPVRVRRALVRQQGSLHRISTSSPQFSIPIRLSLEEIKNLSATPRLLYTLPLNDSAAAERVLASAYGL